MKYIFLLIGALIPFTIEFIDKENEKQDLKSKFLSLKKLTLGARILLFIGLISTCAGIYQTYREDIISQTEKKMNEEKLNNELENTKALLKISNSTLSIANATNSILNAQTQQIQKQFESQREENMKLKFPIENDFRISYVLSIDVEKNNLQNIEKLVIEHINNSNKTNIDKIGLDGNGVGIIEKSILNSPDNHLNSLKGFFLAINFSNLKNEVIFHLSRQFEYPFTDTDDLLKEFPIDTSYKRVYQGSNNRFNNRVHLFYFSQSRKFKIMGSNIPLERRKSPYYTSIYDLNNTKADITFWCVSCMPTTKQPDFNIKYDIEEFRVSTESGAALNFNKLETKNRYVYYSKVFLSEYTKKAINPKSIH